MSRACPELIVPRHDRHQQCPEEKRGNRRMREHFDGPDVWSVGPSPKPARPAPFVKAVERERGTRMAQSDLSQMTDRDILHGESVNFLTVVLDDDWSATFKGAYRMEFMKQWGLRKAALVEALKPKLFKKIKAA